MVLLRILTSSVFGALLSPRFRGIPVYAVVRQLRRGKGPDEGPLPPEPKHLQQVLLPPQVVGVGLPVGLECRLACKRQSNKIMICSGT